MNKRKIELDDMYKLKFCSDVQMSFDGNKFVYVLNTLDKEADGYMSKICVCRNFQKPVDLVVDASFPRWLNDNENIVFLKSYDGIRQLFAININTNKKKQITNLTDNIDLYSISPDNKKICLVINKKVKEFPSKFKTRYIEKMNYKDDEVKGFKDIYHSKQIFILNLDDNSLIQVTKNNFNLESSAYYGLTEPSWSNDSSKIAFSSRVEDEFDRDINPWKSDIFTIDINNLELKCITNSNGIFIKPIWLKDDEEIISLGHFNEHYRATNISLYKIKLNSKEFINLTKNIDMTVEDCCLTDSQLGKITDLPVVSEDLSTIYFLASNCGNTDLMKLNICTNSVVNLNTRDRRIYSFTTNKSCENAVLLYSDVTNPSKISLFNLKTGDEKLIIDENKELLDDIILSIPEKTNFLTSDGLKERGWIIKPNDYRKETKYKTLLEIHGGPFMSYENTFMFEFQLFAAKGYNIIYCNPIGSRGYSEKLAYSILDSYGKRDYKDLMNFVNHAISEFDCIDENKLCLAGGSYGGFMTNWIVTQTNRFKAAIAQRSISNWMSLFGTADIEYSAIENVVLGREVKRLEELLEISPITYVDNVNTPLLLMQSEFDIRCTVDQAEQFYVALKHMKKDVSLIIFPKSNHGLSRNGNPSLRTLRLKKMVDFMDKYIE